jgi:hypothetical protein
MRVTEVVLLLWSFQTLFGSQDTFFLIPKDSSFFQSLELLYVCTAQSLGGLNASRPFLVMKIVLKVLLLQFVTLFTLSLASTFSTHFTNLIVESRLTLLKWCLLLGRGES